MATAEQFDSMLKMLQKQMDKMDALQKENEALRLNQTPPSAETKLKRPDRPIIESNLSDSEWALFLDTWKRYKVMAALSKVDEIRMELRAACSTDVNKLLFEFIGPTTLDTATEEELLQHIKGIAVKGLHTEVHRVNFGKIKQEDGESVTHFVAKLKAQSTLCNFSVTCTCEEKVSFAEEMVAQQLVAGLRDPEHQSKILSEATTLNTLKLKVARLQALETTEESATKLNVPPSSSAATKSAYKKSNNGGKTKPASDSAKPPNNKTSCLTCGRSNHWGRSMSFKDCPASHKDKKCNTCGKPGHFSSVCKTKTKAAAGKQDSDEAKNDTEDESTEASTAYFFATTCPEEQQTEGSLDFRHRPMST